MILYHTYYIKFRRNGKPESQTKRYQASNPGSAFAKCVKKFPDCQLLEGWREERLIVIGGDYCCLIYAPPSTARIVAEPIPRGGQTLFGFVDDEISLNPKKQADAATYRPCNENRRKTKLKIGEPL
jgi:hypothetical protein